MQFCPKIKGGQTALITNPDETKEAIDTFHNIVFEPGKSIQKQDIHYSDTWVPITRSSSDGRWVDFYSGKDIQSSELIPAGTERQTCVVYKGEWNKTIPWNCAGSSNEFYCTCHFKEKPYLSLRGLCKDSNIDLMYLPQNHPRRGILTINGLRKTQMQFVEQKWTLSGLTENTTGYSNATISSFALGKQAWMINGENSECKVGHSFLTLLKLTGCQEGEYTCDDGQCIYMEQRCDQALNCRDESDEVDCKTIVLKKSYRKTSPPVFVTEKNRIQMVNPATVMVTVTLLDISAIRESENEIDIKFACVFKCIESRGSYYNLKKKQSQNSLVKDEIEKIWIPNLIYRNNKDNDNTRLGLDRSSFFIDRKGNFTRSGLDVLDEIEIFRGIDNPIKMMQSYTKQFQCKFDLKVFPFDTQVIAIVFNRPGVAGAVL